LATAPGRLADSRSLMSFLPTSPATPRAALAAAILSLGLSPLLVSAPAAAAQECSSPALCPGDDASQVATANWMAGAARARGVPAGRPDPAASELRYGEWAADILRPPAQYRGRYQLRLSEARSLILPACVSPPGTLNPPPPPLDETARPFASVLRLRGWAPARCPPWFPAPASPARLTSFCASRCPVRLTPIAFPAELDCSRQGGPLGCAFASPPGCARQSPGRFPRVGWSRRRYA